MRTFFGMILGAFLTVVGVYLYDSANTSTVASNDPSARTIVNWDVAAADWQIFKDRSRKSWKQLTENLDDKS